jgi:demethylmenaquinone methyltransferase / 2-methoxy-6-polyprenyl-1,4-benzoquinol methylase
MSDTVDYGFQNVSPVEKRRRVQSVFERVASRYDIMNDVMSGGLHRVWKDHFVDRVHPKTNEHILDIAGGTGDIAFRMAKRGAQVMVTDINPEMLEAGKKRRDAKKYALSWQVENAETLSFENAQFDAVTIAFGIRNVTDKPQALSEALRVLKFGGRFFILEFSKQEWPLASTIYDAYSLNVVPKLGKLIAGDEEAYQYLVESIRQFPDAPTFAQMMTGAGFSQVKFQRLLGGVVAIHSGWKL